FEELEIRNAAAALVLGLVLIAVVLVVAGTAKVRALGTEIRLFLAGRGAVPAALALSVVAVSGHLLVFVVAARMVNDAAPLADLIAIAVLALVAMSLPLNVGGWGPREAASAGGFAAAGLGASHGVAAAVVFGVLVLLASAPGLVVLAAHAIGERPGLRPAIPRDEREQQQQDGGHDRATGRAHGELGDDRADHHADQAHRRQPAQDRDEQPDGSRELDDAGRVPEPVAETEAAARLGEVGVTTQHRAGWSSRQVGRQRELERPYRGVGRHAVAHRVRDAPLVGCHGPSFSRRCAGSLQDVTGGPGCARRTNTCRGHGTAALPAALRCCGCPRRFAAHAAHRR